MIIINIYKLTNYLKIRRGHLTQEEFATKLNISKSYYAKLESGEREISKKILLKLKQENPALDTNIFFKD